MKTKILIVDDLSENIRALSKLIEAEDVEIISASDPDQALNHMLDHEFGLALLDVQMPTMSGFELARLIRSVDKGRHLPIIFVTAQASESSLILEGYDTGAVDLLFKPLEPHIVRSKVRVFVRLDQQSRQLSAQVETMARLKQEAEAANVAKSRFLANMSHEIRTPLSAVLGFADVLSQDELPQGDRQDCISSISRNGKLLLRIIDDILDLSRIEAQRLELDSTKFDLNDLYRDLELTLQYRAIEKGISLEFAKTVDFGGRFISDPLRIKQILLNIVGNAIKFTNQGSVKVKADSRFVDKSNEGLISEIRFVVEDSGVGLTDEAAQRLFEPFAQADSSTRRIYGGTGLGLVISRQLARSLGGEVKLKSSTAGKGSVFEVSIRALQAAPEVGDDKPVVKKTAIDSVLGERLQGKRILVVDDVIDNRKLIERYLKPVGVVVDQAPGGREALELMKDPHWDAVLMDIQMPYMDGYEATAAIRATGFDKPIIALTAHAMREELERCLNAGCNMTLTKPIAKKELIERLTDIVL